MNTAKTLITFLWGWPQFKYRLLWTIKSLWCFEAKVSLLNCFQLPRLGLVPPDNDPKLMYKLFMKVYLWSIFLFFYGDFSSLSQLLLTAINPGWTPVAWFVPSRALQNTFEVQLGISEGKWSFSMVSHTALHCPSTCCFSITQTSKQLFCVGYWSVRLSGRTN